MLVPLSWVRDYVDIAVTPAVLAEQLTLRGMEVTGIEASGGDVILDVDVKPNRGDALSMIGMAREIAALTGGEVRMPAVVVPEMGVAEGQARLEVHIEAARLCPRFTARYLTRVRNGESPEWMRRRLSAAGMRPVNSVVDVTNYVMQELGQPMHAYDADSIAGGQIIVRWAHDGEQLQTIDHEVRRLDNRIPVIADASRVIGLAGLMGGIDTEVRSNTVNVVLEAAIFHGPTIRNAARRLGLRSEASTRHEKGIGDLLPRYALDRAAQLVAEITGACVAGGVVDNGSLPSPGRVVSISVSRMERLLGIELTVGEIRQLLVPLGFAVTSVDDHDADVAVPAHRLDVTEPADVAEEIARAFGYARIETRLPRAKLPPFRPDPSEQRHRVRRVLAGLGVDEIVTHALIGPYDLTRTGYDPEDGDLIRLANPVSEEHSILRPNMYPSLLSALQENLRWRRTAAWLFEVGKCYWFGRESQCRAETSGTGRYEAWHVGLALLGPGIPRSIGNLQRDADVSELKGILEALHAQLGVPTPIYRQESGDGHTAHLHAGRAATLIDAAGRPYGTIGEVAPGVAEAWGIPGGPVIAALNLECLFANSVVVLRAAAPPAAQPITRDLAVVVPEDVPVDKVMHIARASAGRMLVELQLFDLYRGEQIGPGVVSYALGLRFQPQTPGSQSAVDDAVQEIRASLETLLGAQFR